MFKLIQIDGIDLICYDNGDIWRQNKNYKEEIWMKFVCNSKGYWRIKINGKLYLVHRLMMFAFKNFDLNSELFVDHLDRDIHNNNLSNLEIKTNQENQFNTNAKGYNKRIYIKKDGTEVIYWITQIRINGKLITKCFKTEEEARNHYLELKAKYHVVSINKYNLTIEK